MGAILRISVQNQLHEKVRDWLDEPDNAFYRFCAKAEPLGVRYVDFIWPYSDAMLNYFQLAAWIEDFPAAMASGAFSQAESTSASNVLEGAREAHALDGYLLLEG